ncbi:hypothetical protein C3747_257g15 [Trypanosoma cruzi]|uniref:Regulatory subunit of protein kinase a-like protein n=2 Tax=Trypanosoma cruzi TaxID=5693 RepID=Q4D1T5_TRYCC|nr:hypothetical protein, conserved [Trypanosoma cruzi]EAN86488.1 hypothetical protein, conserved [Trypanosoma cruzi]KAF5221908.1 hypothetical protein ECC02_005075 [Trypanosoma cruzi]KAF8279295.1 hypothetical protein TcYC6_0018320 [Trypanosoma cruzi]PWU96443.1 hypothetical protein C3747_257g15 [Trypanosoma cruzi]RNC50827.1 putative regulatory subunit of protein kinase a-like protein [Trypanosoma cruzi]|eukprot:XP_808339.1 hypothetical protein [Trypanosoma cruzi strain CL Brener]
MSRERRDAASSDAGDDVTPAKFNFSEGTGTPLAELPAVRAVGNRGAAWKQLETVLEPLHRMVFGRPGRTGERRRALEPFCGFPEAMREVVLQSVQKLKKDKLRELIQALGMPVQFSITHARMADGVAAFLMQPHVAGTRVSSPGKTPQPQTRAVKRERATTVSESGGAAKTPKREVDPASTGAENVKESPRRMKNEMPVAESSSAVQPPSDDTIRVAVYKRVLATSRAERSHLTTKALRLELERQFSDLEGRKVVIREAASECLAALIAAEEAAIISASLGNAAAVASLNGGDRTVEPSPAPHPPQFTEPPTVNASRSQAPPPVTPDGSVALNSSVPTFPAHPPTTLPTVSIPPQLPPGAPMF